MKVNSAVSNSVTVVSVAATDTVRSSSSLMVTVDCAAPCVKTPPPEPVVVAVPRLMMTVSSASLMSSWRMVTVMSEVKVGVVAKSLKTSMPLVGLVL